MPLWHKRSFTEFARLYSYFRPSDNRDKEEGWSEIYKKKSVGFLLSYMGLSCFYAGSNGLGPRDAASAGIGSVLHS